MHAEHFKNVCTGCGKVVSECPCEVADKPVLQVMCPACAAKLKPDEAPGTKNSETRRPFVPGV
jgi:NAD-dependent SIR2 family protein deacetylase